MYTEEIRTKPKNYKKSLLGILAYVKPQSKLLLGSLVLMFIANLALLLGPYLSGEAIDAIGQGKDIKLVGTYALLMGLSYGFGGLLTYTMTRMVVKMAQITTANMRQDTFAKIIDLPLSYIDSHHAGDLVSRISYDLNLVNQALNNYVIQIFSSLLMIGGSLLMMISISKDMSMIFLLLVPVTVVFTAYRMKKTRPLFSKRSWLLGKMNAYVEEILYGHTTISAYHGQEYFSDEFKKRNKESMEAYYKADYQASMNGPSISLITNLSLALIAMVGGLLYLRGGVTIGYLTSFILYSRRFSGPINELAEIFSELQSALSAAERVFNLLEEPSEPEDGSDAREIKDVKGQIEFKEVDFAYEEAKPVIKDFNLIAERAKLTAIVGPTGSGKSTIINLLMRFYDPQGGQILIDGQPIKDITRASLRESFAMVLQDSWLFQGTIRENITYAKPGASDEEVERVVKAANLDDFIKSLPDGYDSIISDGAGNLSQGQKQLISIARAMLVDAPILILDEATSNVDSRTEIKIQEAMNRLLEGRTSIVIAHRLSTIQNADKIVVLVNGLKREEGNHQDLLALNGYYADLYKAQFV